MRAGYTLAGSALTLSALLASCATTGHSPVGHEALFEQEITAGLEEISVTRTIRTQFIQGATPVCSAAPFPAVSEQHYDTWSLSLRTSDARVVKTHEKQVGRFMACFGSVNPTGAFAMYSTGTAGSLSYTVIGECRFMKSKAPAPKLLVLTCNGDLSGLPAEYVGGYLTTSSLAPSGGKDAVDVPGYLSTSVITMRLWKKPRQ
jgi:hypothetical protein